MWSYDKNGRLTHKTDTLTGGQSATVNATRSFDFNNELIGGNCSPTAFCSGDDALTYSWTESGKVAMLFLRNPCALTPLPPELFASDGFRNTRRAEVRPGVLTLNCGWQHGRS